VTLYQYTDKNAIQLLATQSRRTDITPYELASVHLEMGKYLAYQIAEEIPLEDVEISHPQGTAIGKRIQNEKDLLIFTFMRAGVYIGDGIRSLFQNAPYYHIYSKRGQGITDEDWTRLELPPLQDKVIILADSVINTGESMRPVIKQLQMETPKKIIVACSVMPIETANKMESEFPDVNFYTIRVSTNSYVGKGKTDTGNRLFGTFQDD
jgi:uracil phosphoribosyltransferase